MYRNTRAHFVPSIAGFAIAVMALCGGLGSPLNADDARSLVDAGKPFANVRIASNLPTKSTDSNMPTTAVKGVTDSRPPISCKVGANGVLSDCRINDGHDLNDVANWFQDEHDQTLHLAVSSITLAKKFERSLESCTENEKAKK
jgi:hypothetical protein